MNDNCEHCMEMLMVSKDGTLTVSRCTICLMVDCERTDTENHQGITFQTVSLEDKE